MLIKFDLNVQERSMKEFDTKLASLIDSGQRVQMRELLEDVGLSPSLMDLNTQFSKDKE